MLNVFQKNTVALSTKEKDNSNHLLSTCKYATRPFKEGLIHQIFQRRKLRLRKVQDFFQENN